MSAMVPMAMYGLEVPPGDVAVPSSIEIPSAYRITMAAIDPSAEPEGPDGAVPRATLKIIRQPLDDYDSEDDEDDEDDFDIAQIEALLGDGDDISESESDEEEVNGGPSDPKKSKAARKAAAQKEIEKILKEENDMDVDEKPNGVNGFKKSAKALGKMPASDEDSDEDDDDDSEDGEMEEFVICTLDPAKNYQQPLDLTIGERERVFFKVSGTHSIFLTGNYVEPTHSHDEPGMYDPDSDEEGDYDLEPDSDELDEYDDEDELDDMEDPRITELEEEEDEEAPKLVEAKKDKKGKNKRTAEEVADSSTIDDLIAKEAQKEEKLSKKQQKKLKKNDGSATAAPELEAPSSTKSDKKVQFAKELEQGPTPTKDTKKEAKTGIKKVQGVTIDDRKTGTGPAAKSGDRVSMRYIGKLDKDGKVFDSNKKGKPFSFKLGSGEVIKGWDIGIAGMSAGGERRITIPANLGYGSKGAAPQIPGNATLVFDVKLLEIHRK